MGITEMTRSFGLELLETILARFPFVFEKVVAELFRHARVQSEFKYSSV